MPTPDCMPLYCSLVITVKGYYNLYLIAFVFLYMLTVILRTLKKKKKKEKKEKEKEKQDLGNFGIQRFLFFTRVLQKLPKCQRWVAYESPYFNCE